MFTLEKLNKTICEIVDNTLYPRVHKLVKMPTDTWRALILQFVTMFQLIMLVQSQICYQEKTKVMTVNRNGRIEKAPLKIRVKECCEGYVMDESNPSLCVSICHDGFILSEGSCIPSCQKCENGECMAPDECKCNDGYLETSEGCSPICEECVNAVCIKPGVCECKEGFISTRDGCVPQCEGCENGLCQKPGECQCAPGYRMSLRDFKCKPKCKRRCQNGYCSGPNKCTCHEGYRKLPQYEYVCVPQHWDDGDADYDYNIDDDEVGIKIDETKWKEFLKIAPEKSPLLVLLKVL